MGQLSEEEDGLESDADSDDTFSQVPDLASYMDDPTYQGIRNFDQDKCRVIVQCKINAMLERKSLGLINQKKRLERSF